MMKVLHLEEVDSTNGYVMREAENLDAPLLVSAHTQTAGRGQRGNHWEAEPGKNLTFSVLYRPQHFPAIAQFAISEAVALAVVDFLNGEGIKASVKWANDIYVDDKKICGILIQHALMGSEISHTVIGAGINVNQLLFLSDAPNPVSMAQVTGKSYDLDNLEQKIADCLEKRLSGTATAEGRKKIHDEFLGNIWRMDGNLHPFVETATKLPFEACIKDILPTGQLILSLADGSERSYWFKEVSFSL